MRQQAAVREDHFAPELVAAAAVVRAVAQHERQVRENVRTSPLAGHVGQAARQHAALQAVPGPEVACGGRREGRGVSRARLTLCGAGICAGGAMRGCSVRWLLRGAGAPRAQKRSGGGGGWPGRGGGGWVRNEPPLAQDHFAGGGPREYVYLAPADSPSNSTVCCFALRPHSPARRVARGWGLGGATESGAERAAQRAGRHAHDAERLPAAGAEREAVRQRGG